MVSVEETVNVRQKYLNFFVNLEEQINNKMLQPGFKPFNIFSCSI